MLPHHADSTTFDDIADGAHSTLLVVEVADSGIHWMEPRDLHINQLAAPPEAAAGQRLSAGHGGVGVFFAGGHVRYLREDIDPSVLRALGDEKRR